MSHIVQETYSGWDITIRCSHDAGKVGHAPRYAAIAEAELQAGENPDDWVDPRMQVMNTGGRNYPDGETCIGALLAEVRQLIDALRK